MKNQKNKFSKQPSQPMKGNFMNLIWKNLMKSLLVCIGISLISAQLFAQTGHDGRPLINPVLPSARVEGLGGAFVGKADDLSSILMNSAGLTSLEHPEFTSSYRFSFDRFRNYEEDRALSAWNINNNLNFVAAGYPFTIMDHPFYAGLAYANRMSVSLAINLVPSNTNEKVLLLMNGMISTISFALATKMFPDLAIGFTLNRWFGSRDEKFNHDYLVVDETFSYRGTNIQIGALWSNEDLRVGAQYGSSFSLKEKGGDYSGPFRSRFEYPEIWSVGINYRFSPYPIELSLDYEHRDVSSVDPYWDLDMESIFRWHGRDLDQFRIGLEYQKKMNSVTIVTRIGYRNLPMLFSAGNRFNWWQKAPADGHSISSGIGFQYRTFAIDLSMTGARVTKVIVDDDYTDGYNTSSIKDITYITFMSTFSIRL